MYRDWHHLFDQMQVLCVQYRGRFPGGMNDTLLQSMEDVAEEILAVLESTVPKDNGQLVFYGHSFGALAAWIVAGRLQNRKDSHLKLLHLFVGGEQSPDVKRRGGALDLNLDEFARYLVDQSMIPSHLAKAIQEDETIKTAVLSATKLEFDLDQGFDISKMRDRPPVLNVPITAFYEAEDETLLTVDEVETWERFTAHRPFECIPIYGPHLFCLPEHNEDELAEHLNERIAQYF